MIQSEFLQVLHDVSAVEFPVDSAETFGGDLQFFRKLFLREILLIMFPEIFIEPIASTISFPLVKYPMFKQPLPLSIYQEVK